MRKEKLLIIVLILASVISIYGQTPQQNHLKYWYYRQRLVNDFMIGIGPEFGLSMPAAERNENPNSQLLKWGDAPAYLCNYIAVLATEYKLLSDNGENTDQTVKELFYAIFALNRLDAWAEWHFGAYPSANLNGFFVRDDVGYGLNMPTVISHLNQGRPTPVITQLSSDYIDMASDPTINEMSKDQVIQILYGLGLVIRYVPTSVTYTEGSTLMQFQDNESSINIAAQNIVKRVVNYMKVGPWDWEIRNPVTQDLVARGNDPWRESCAFAAAKFKLTGELTPSQDPASSTAACELFETFQNFIIPNDQDYKILMLDAVANLWPEGMTLDNSNNDYNAFILGPRSIANGEYQYEIIPLIHQGIHGGPNYLFLMDEQAMINYYEYLLNTAPCFGPYNYENGNYPHYEWSSSGRFYHPDQRGKMDLFYPGDFNGLDYMLLHNLWYILYGHLYPPTLNSMDGSVIHDFPYITSSGPATGFGSHASPLTVGAFNTITAHNTIFQDGDVTYRAGEEIILEPGFVALSGSDFVAYIDPYDCSTGTFQRLAQDTSIFTPSIKTEHFNISIFPNPSSGKFNIRFMDETTAEGSRVNVYDVLGNVIYSSSSLPREFQLDISDEAKGVYIIKFQARDGQTKIERLIYQ